LIFSEIDDVVYGFERQNAALFLEVDSLISSNSTKESIFLQFPNVSLDILERIYTLAACDSNQKKESYTPKLDIKKYTDNKKASEALNFVLRFVQKAFQYERDDEQFGREKVMFAEETLYYDKSDCEDRAVLYARLVKDLFGISVVGVKYKDHMSTALHVPLQGDSVKVAGQRYVIADATYINASLGQNVPKYKSIIPDSFIYVK